MRKIAAILLSAILSVCLMGTGVFASSEESYKYECTGSLMADVTYQGYEDYDPMEDYSNEAMPKPDMTGQIYGFFSFMGVDATAGVMVTDKDPLSDDMSLRIKGRVDARRWTIDTSVPFYPNDQDGYAMEFKIRFDTMPENSSVAFKISDVNSKAHDNESAENPIISFVAADNGVKLKNLTGTELATLELNKAYTVAIACMIDSSDYYLFIDGQYVPNSKAQFNCDFYTLSAIRLDVTSDAEITLDDLLLDGVDVSSASASAPATEAPTVAPTDSPSDTATAAPTSGTGTGTQTVTPKPAQATPNASPAQTQDEGGISTGLIIGIAAAAVVVVVAVIAVIVAKTKKKK